jgi:hypothetical protein
MNALPLIGGVLAMLAGIAICVAVDAQDRGHTRSKWVARWIALISFGLALALVYAPAHARDVMEIRNVGVILTDERGTCPRDHAIAKFTDLTRGCWTIGEHDRITRIYRNGHLFATYSSARLEIYAERLP